MQKNTAIAVGALALGLSSCLAGPKQLTRSLDNWDQKLYIDNPWIDGILWVVPVFPLAYYGASFGDFFINGYYFWVKDAWDMKGTGFKYYQPEATDGTMESLLYDDAKFCEVK
jgi:hypothetical protein